MQNLPPFLFKQWMHHFEDDAGGISRYKPAGTRIPRARGRDGLEFRADGTLVDVRIDPGDRSRRVSGRWHQISEGLLVLTFDDGSPAKEAEIVSLDDASLQLRLRIR